MSNPLCIATYKGWGNEDLVKEIKKEWPLTWRKLRKMQRRCIQKVRVYRNMTSYLETYGMHARSVVSDSLRTHGLARQAPLSTEFSRQEYRSELLFPSS